MTAVNRIHWVRFFGITSTLILSATFVKPQESSSVSTITSVLDGAVLSPMDRHGGTTHTFRISDGVFVSAYQDVVRILQGKNECSDFFGGPEALEAFDHLGALLRKTYIDKSVGIRMSGDYVIFERADSSLRYRVFEKAEINGRGTFFRQNSLEKLRTSAIGSFSANTREARALMLLHELGHMIETSRGHWLLADDGNDGWKSKKNTRIVEKHCAQVIRAMR